jgi:heptosyltransferase-2
MKKILVIQTASIGDVILATPVLEKLYTFFPGAAIDILVKKGIEPLFDNHPFLHEVLVWDKKRGKYRNFDKLMHRVWYSKYDLVVNLQRFFLTGLMTAFSRAGVKIGFDKNPLSFFFTHQISHEIGTGLHEVERNLSLITYLTDNTFTPPRLYPSDQDEMKVARWKQGTYYTISPASLWFTKQYPEEKWVELINTIPFETPVYLLGSKSDNELCQSIIQKSVNKVCVDLSGKLTFLESAALMKGARMNFTNDSAPMHLASAVNAPVTAIYCSTTPDFGFGPLSDHRAVVEVPAKLDCRPCGLHGYRACPEKHFRCANNIPVALLRERL